MGLFLAHFCLFFFPFVNLSGFSYSIASVLAQDQYLAVPFRGSAALVAGAAWLSGFMGENFPQWIYHPNMGFLQDGMTILHRTSTPCLFWD